jgi:hypothetical protein
VLQQKAPYLRGNDILVAHGWPSTPT